MSDLVKRLREEYSWNARQICTSTQVQDTLLSEAAARIEELEAALQRDRSWIEDGCYGNLEIKDGKEHR